MNSIYVLGAGFSKAAGFPLGCELFNDILIEIKKTPHYDNILKRDMNEYIKYQYKMNNLKIKENNIILEDFISFLDIEHFLRLRGGDTWSEEGNKSQILIKNYIAKVLYNILKNMSKDSIDLYLKFAKGLDPTDYVITFNYDTLIETCLEKLGKPYRLFPLRFKEVGPSYNAVEFDQSEIIILKMHGSIDWFDISPFDRYYRYSKDYGDFFLPKHLIFSNPNRFQPQKIVNGPFNKESPLYKIYRVKNLDEYFKSTSMLIACIPHFQFTP